MVWSVEGFAVSTRSRRNRWGQSVSRDAEPRSYSRARTRRRRAPTHDSRIDRRGRRYATNPGRSRLRHRNAVREGIETFSRTQRRTMSKAWASKQTAFFSAASNALQNSELANCKLFRRGRALRIYVRGNLTRCETHRPCAANASAFDRVELRSVCYFCALLNCVSLPTARENVFSSIK